MTPENGFTKFSGTGRTEKVSRCCGAHLSTKGSYADFYDVCSACGAGRWPNGVTYDFVYFPSDYEHHLEREIESLRSLVNKLLTEKEGA